MKLFGPVTRSRELRDSAVHNPFESPTFPLTSLALDSVYGSMNRSDSGESVTVNSSLGLPTFWRCVGLLSTVIAGCPIRTYRNPGKIEVFPAMLNPGNSTMTYTQFELWELVVVHIAVWGNAFVLKIRAPGPDGPNSGPITDLKPINPDRVEVRIENGEKVFHVTQIDTSGNPVKNAPPLKLSIFEIMHVPGMGYDGVSGLSVIQQAQRTLGTAMAGDRLAARFYNKGSMLSGILNVKAPIAKQEQADSIRERWLQKSGGLDHAAEVAILDAETTFQPLSIPPDQLQFLESRKWQCNEVARWFGIPPHLVGDVEKSTSWGAGIEDQNIGFVAYTISGWTNRIEQRATREIISVNKQYCEFDLDRLLRGNMTERFTAYGVGIINGFITRNEVRVKENMEPLAGLDAPLVPLNMAMASTDTNPMGTTVPAGDAPAPTDDQDSDPE